MSTAGHTPNFVAQEAIYPFRVVQFGSQPFSLMQATQSDEVLAGVTDGSVQGFNASTHATAGQVCSLQNGEFVQVTAGGTIVPSDLLVATNDGKVIAAELGSTEAILQAAEAAEDGEIFWAKKIGAWTLGGGVSPIVGGSWPDPNTKILWQTDFLTLIPSSLNDSQYGSTPEYFANEQQGGGFAAITKPYPFTEANHAGIIALEAGGSSAGANASMWCPGAAQDLNTTVCAALDVGSHECVGIYMLIDEASVNSHSHFVGFGDSGLMSGGPLPYDTYGILFRFQPGEYDGNWQCVVKYTNGFSAVEQVVDSGIPAMGLNWVNLRVFITEGVEPNPLPTALFFIDGVQVASIDTNNPPPGCYFDFSREYYVGAGFKCHDEDGYSSSQIDYLHYLALISR